MKKQYPRKNASMKTILQGIREGLYYVDALLGRENHYKPVHGFESMTVDINACDFFDIDKRYIIQTVRVPQNKRGNLSKYKGQKVKIIATTVSNSGARMNFLIKEK
jgi:hypothetical protein